MNTELPPFKNEEHTSKSASTLDCEITTSNVSQLTAILLVSRRSPTKYLKYKTALS